MLQGMLYLQWNSDILFDVLHSCSPEKLTEIWLQLLFIIISGSKPISRIFIAINFKCAQVLHHLMQNSSFNLCAKLLGSFSHTTAWALREIVWNLAHLKLIGMKIRLIGLEPKIIMNRRCNQILINFSGEQLRNTSNTMSEFHRR